MENTEVKEISSEELKSLLNKGKKKRPVLKAVLAGIVALIIVGGLFLYFSNKKDDQNEQVFYQQYTVSKGDISVGIDEKGYAELEDEEITFPVEATVSEIYVVSGQNVSAGDMLLKLNPDDISSSIDSYKTKLADAELQLRQAELDYTNGELSARQQLETTQANSSIADDSMQNTLDEYENNYNKAVSALEEAKENTDTYDSLSETFLDDYDKKTEYITNIEYYTQLLEDYNSEKTTLNTDYTSYLASETKYNEAIAKKEDYNDDIDDLIQSIGTASSTSDVMSQISAIYKKIDDLNDEINETSEDAIVLLGRTKVSLDDINDKIDTTQTTLDNLQDEYDDFNEYYNDLYGNNDDLQDITDQLSKYQQDVIDYEIALKKAELDNETKSLSTKQQAESTDLAKSQAESVYNLAIMQLQSKLNTAQENYDDAEADLKSLTDLVDNSGIIYSEVDGRVSSVNVVADQYLSIANNSSTTQTIMSISKQNEVYIPVSVSEEDILDIEIGQQVEIEFTAYNDLKFDGEVESIVTTSSKMGASAVSYTVNIKLTGEDIPQIYSGMSAEINIIRKKVSNILYVKNNAITFENGSSYVNVKDSSGNPSKTKVVTGFSDGQYTEIVSGLDEDDILLSESAVKF